jgi:hypothetical protein
VVLLPESAVLLFVWGNKQGRVLFVWGISK